jgi:hypothetical protein
MSRAENYFGHLSASALPARDPNLLKANAIFGLILAAGVVAMAFAGSRTVGSRDATMADNRDASDVAAAAARSRQTGVPSTD